MHEFDQIFQALISAPFDTVWINGAPKCPTNSHPGFFERWQTLIAGVLALIGAIITVKVMRRQTDIEQLSRLQEEYDRAARHSQVIQINAEEILQWFFDFRFSAQKQDGHTWNVPPKNFDDAANKIFYDVAFISSLSSSDANSVLVIRQQIEHMLVFIKKHLRKNNRALIPDDDWQSFLAVYEAKKLGIERELLKLTHKSPRPCEKHRSIWQCVISWPFKRRNE